jgi:hypothetical protein
MLFNLWTDEVLSCDYIILQTEITMVKGNKIKKNKFVCEWLLFNAKWTIFQ